VRRRTARVSSARAESEGACDPRSKIWLERDGAVVLSEWRVKLLETVDELGSLTLAAERLDVPYRTAWYKLREVQKRLSVDVVATQRGGADGGGMRLTPAGRDLVTRFRRVAAGVAELVDARFRAELGDLVK
jgi:molybdate transport system regulatory protein